jgi:hypothetical protein
VPQTGKPDSRGDPNSAGIVYDEMLCVVSSPRCHLLSSSFFIKKISFGEIEKICYCAAWEGAESKPPKRVLCCG